MWRLEIDTSEVDDESDNQLPLLLSADINFPSSFKTGKPRPAKQEWDTLNIVKCMATQFTSSHMELVF